MSEIKTARCFRSSNFEFLRIVAMFLIVIHHCMVHGVQHVLSPDLAIRSAWLSEVGANRMLTIFFAPGGAIGVGVFFMISGYFMYEKSPRIKKIVEMLAEVFFYSFFLLAFFFCIKCSGLYSFPELGKGFSFVLSMLFPVGRTTWWFFTVWLLLYCMNDSITALFGKLTEKQYIRFLIIFFIFFIFVGSVLLEPYESIQRGIFYFLLGRYFRQFPQKQSVCLCSLCAIFWWSVSVCIQFVEMNIAIRYGMEFVVSHRIETVLNGIADGFVAPFCALFLFLSFKNIQIKNHPAVNVLASTTFGIYLLHASPLGTETLWKVFYTGGGMNNFPLKSFALCFGIFIVCSVVDLFRQKLFSFVKRRFV